jgi:hypothetical protein
MRRSNVGSQSLGDLNSPAGTGEKGGLVELRAQGGSINLHMGVSENI